MKTSHQKRKLIIKTLAGILALFFMLATYLLLEPYLLTVTRTEISSNDLPESFNGVSIAFISDIHHGPFFNRQRVSNVVQRVNSLGADIIILGGDYVHREPKYINAVFEELSQLQATLGVYAVLGNHDHWESAPLTRKAIAKAGIRLIDNQALWIHKGDDQIRLGGVGDLWEDTPDITPTIQGVTNEDFVILVSHNPDFVEQLKTELIDIMLSGHTHGGQVTLFGLWAPLVPSRFGQKYRTGLKKFNGTEIYISKGIGTITPPVRFFAPPEINLIRLGKP